MLHSVVVTFDPGMGRWGFHATLVGNEDEFGPLPGATHHERVEALRSVVASFGSDFDSGRLKVARDHMTWLTN